VKQAGDDVMETAPSPAPAPAPRRELLRGGARITAFILKRKAEREDTRWLYAQLPAFAGAIWRLKEDGELLAWSDELTELLEAKAAEAKANALAAAAAKAVEKEAVTEAARKAAQPAPARSRKSPVREAATQRQDRRRSRQPEPVS
jgi:hypothetical protein